MKSNDQRIHPLPSIEENPHRMRTETIPCDCNCTVIVADFVLGLNPSGSKTNGSRNGGKWCMFFLKILSIQFPLLTRVQDNISLTWQSVEEADKWRGEFISETWWPQ